MLRVPFSRTTLPAFLLLLLLSILMLLAPAAEAKKKNTTRETLQFEGQERTYVLYVPEDVAPDEQLPLLIALHGSGRDGESIVNPWIRLAKTERILVAGPESLDSSMWAAPEDGPDFLLHLIDHLEETYPVDPQRVYLFGHSAGAHFAIQIGLFKSDRFAAVAAHAGANQPGNEWLYEQARRKIPIYLVSGANDTVVPIISVRRTYQELKDAGFPVELHEMPRHDHNYYVMAKRINEGIWEFLQQHRLPGK
jgi:poly(3-hydroxybutyrate) depolymerase